MKKITPTALANASNCLYTWQLECFGDPNDKSELDDGLKMLIQRGIEFEDKCANSLENVSTPDWDGRKYQEGYEETIKLMHEGAEWVYQAVLMNEELFGFPDLLKRIDQPSNIGDHSYLPIDIKSHKSVTKKDRFQLYGYAMLLEEVLGNQIDTGGIWLNTNEIEYVDLNKYMDDFKKIHSDMIDIQTKKLGIIGFRCGQCVICPWSNYCLNKWKDAENICLVYGLTGATAKKYWDAGYKTYHDIVKSSPSEIQRKTGANENSASKTFLLAKAWSTHKVQVIKKAVFPEDIPLHFWDIETYDSVTYLHGNIRVYGDEREERLFFADSPEQEEEVWHQYLDYLAQDEHALVYNWADYERSFAHSLWDKYKGNEKGYKHLKDNMLDQCAFVREHFALPVSSYSIKKVAPYFGFSWDASDAGGLNSESWYGDWLDSHDQSIKEKILRYNLDDVLAMEVIHNELIRFTEELS